MSFDIKEKLERIATKEEFKSGKYTFFQNKIIEMKIEIGVSLFLLSIPKILGLDYLNLLFITEITLVMDTPEEQRLLTIISYMLTISTFVAGSILFKYLKNQISSLKENKRGIFAEYYFKQKIENNLKDEFNSVDNIIMIYNKLRKAKIELSDKNIRSFYSEMIINENNKKEERSIKLKRIEEKINILEQEKENLISKDDKKILRKVEKKNRISFNPVRDIAIPIPEFAKVRN